MGCLGAIGLVAAAAALALSLLAEPASATVLEDEQGNHVASFRASDEAGIVFHPPVGSVSCAISGLKARGLSTGGSGETVRAPVRVLSLRWCRDTVKVLRNGELEVQAVGPKSDGNGALASDGMRLTVEYHGFHCVFETDKTEIGTLTGASATGYVATIDLDGAIPRAGGGSGAFCGSAAAWTGSYQLVTAFGVDVT